MTGRLAIREINSKTILSKSGIPGADYCINAYVGCSHACRYCYATFMQRYSGHTEQWGRFVDVKINAPDILNRQMARAKKGHVMVSSVTDAYQPVEVKYRLTRRCLEILQAYRFPVGILTKSPLVLRDMDVIKKFEAVEVGITITTDDEKMRKVFEPAAPPISARIETLKKLKSQGINTYVFIGPMLPMEPEKLASMIGPYADEILLSRMNYISKTAHLYRKLDMMRWLEKDFAEEIKKRLASAFEGKKIRPC